MSDYEIRRLAASACVSKEPCEYHLELAWRFWHQSLDATKRVSSVWKRLGTVPSLPPDLASKT